MAFRTWARILWAALGVGALAGAGQLGMAYGLRLVRIDRAFEVTVRDQWAAQLTWVAWFAMVAAVAGALAGGRLAGRDPRRPGGGAAAAIAIAGALGAAVVVPLTMLPARTAQVAGVDPVAAVAICAVLGTVLGAAAGYAALAYPVARWSLATVAAAVWVIGVGAVLPSLGQVDPVAVRLGVLDVGGLAATQRAALLTMPTLALLTGAGLGWAARRQGMSMITVGLAGLPGPALLTLGYLISGPGSTRLQQVPYWAAMLALGAGALGSVLAAVLGRGDEQWPGTSTHTTASDSPSTDPEASRTATSGTAAPGTSPSGPRAADAPSRPPLPRRVRRADSAADSAADDGPDGPAASPRPTIGSTGTRPRRAARPTPSEGRATSEGRTTSDDAGPAPRTPRRSGSTAAPTPPVAASPETPSRGPRPTSPPRPAPAPVTPPPPTPFQVSAPLPTPTPASAPLPPPRPTERHPGATPPPATPPTAAPAGADRIRPQDEEYVDWVTGLGDDPKK